MRGIEAEEKQVPKHWRRFFCIAERGAIGLINKCQIAITRSLFKTTRNFLQRGRIDFIKAPASRAELIEKLKEFLGLEELS